MSIYDFLRQRVLENLLFLARKIPRGPLRAVLENSLRALPHGHSVGCRAQQINSIAKQMNRCGNYLEIGVQFGFTLASVEIDSKTGVDPNLRFNPRLAPEVTLYSTSSDEFFSRLPEGTKYDFIFLDGLHTFEQTARDFLNALRHLRPGGVIVVDDVVPSSEAKALPDRDESLRRQLEETGSTDGEWFGDVWKLPVAVEKIFAGELEVRTFGYGVCGQAIFWESVPGAELESKREMEFWPYDELKFSDYFPCEDVVLLPGYSRKFVDCLGKSRG